MATQPLASGKLRFDDFELDVRAGELRRRGVRLRLRGQPLQVLEILLERAGDVVTREEFQRLLWPADTFVDFDHSLHNAVARIREIIGDSAESPRYIETLPRRGYRYIGPVEHSAAAAAIEKAPDTGQRLPLLPPQEQRRHLGILAGALVVFVLAALGIVAWKTWRQVHAKAAGTPVGSVAVLPLSNLSGDPSEEFFSDGMTDQLITDLAKFRSLRVISRTSVMQYKGTTKSLPAIAKELNVDAIVEGSVIRSGQRVRVTAQLLQARTDQHIWADTYDRDRGDILKLQEEVADAIARQVRAQITPAHQEEIGRARSVNPGAYDAYIKGRLYFTTEFYKPDSLKKAQGLFEDAIRDDPGFALAYAGLADTYLYLAFDGAMPKQQAYEAAKTLVGKALQLDDSMGEAWDTQGELSGSFDWDWDTADRAFNRAIALAPSYSCAHEDRAQFLASVGRRSEALAEIATIDQLDTSFSSIGTESNVYFLLRDYRSLIESGKRGLILDPKDADQHYYLGVGYEGTGRLREAITEFQQAVQTSDDPRLAVTLAHAWRAAGDDGKAEKLLHALLHNRKAMASPYTMATIYTGLGEKDRALALLERACREKSLDARSIRSDFLLDGLSADPRFQDLLRRVGLA